jgi:hypothetical protein
MTPTGLISWIGWARCSQKPEEIFILEKQPVKVKARTLFCYWAVRELGLTMAGLAPKLNISQPAVSIRDLRKMVIFVRVQVGDPGL